jgi:hypothetical protein
LFLFFFILAVMPENPIFRDIYTADPSARVWEDGRLYVYPSHDIFPVVNSDMMDKMDKYHVCFFKILFIISTYGDGQKPLLKGGCSSSFYNNN